MKVLAQTGKLEGGTMVRSVMQVVQSEGVLSMFKGNLANRLKVGPQKAMKFLGYENLKYFLCKNPRHPTVVEDFCCASGMACIALVATYPLDTIKTHLSVTKQKETITQAFRNMY